MSRGKAQGKYLIIFAALCTWESIKGDVQGQELHGDPFVVPGAVQPPSTSSQSSSTQGAGAPLDIKETLDQAVSEPEVVLSDEEQGETGNWLRKKEWVKQGRELESAIQELVIEVQAAKVTLYESKGTSIAHELEQFHSEVGMGYGEIDGIVASVQEYLDERVAKAQETKNDESVVKPTGEVVPPLSVYELQDQVDARKLELEQLKLDMNYVADLDKALSERIKKVDEMVTYVLDHAKQSDEILTKMWYIIDHQKARLRYYEMNDHYEKIKAAASYLKTDLSQNFDIIATEIKSQMAKCLESIKRLEDKDLIIKSRTQRIEDIRAKKKIDEEALAQQQETSKKPRKKEHVSSSLMSLNGIYDAISTACVSLWEWLVGLFGMSSNTLQPVRRKNKTVAAPDTGVLAVVSPNKL